MGSKHVTGQIVYIRKLSKKIAFFHIETLAESKFDEEEEQDEDEEENDAEDEEEVRVTVVMKSWVAGPVLERAVRGGVKLHCGDQVKFIGEWEDEVTFSAEEYSMMAAWSVTSPLKPFLPRPPLDTFPLSTEQLQICKAIRVTIMP